MDLELIKIDEMFEIMPHALYLKDGKGCWLKANNEMRKICFFKNQKIVGKNSLELAQETPKLRQFFEWDQKSDEEVWEKGKKIVFEKKIKLLNDNIEFLEILKVPVYDKACRKKALFAHLTNITGRKSMYDSLYKKIRENKALFEAIPDTIFTLSKDGYLLSCNLGSEYLGNLETGGDLKGKNLCEILTKNYAKLFLDNLEQVLKTGLIQNFEYELIVNDNLNEVGYFEVRMVPYDENEVIAIVSDITEKKRMYKKSLQLQAEAEEANRAKSDFLARMSHEIRTPLNGILGLAELLQAGNIAKEEKKFVDNIVYSSHVLLNVLNDILDFSKIEAGKLVLEELEFSLVELVEEVVLPWRYRCAKKNIVLFYQIEESLPKFFVGDKMRIQQMIINLLNNAYKFTNQGKIEVLVKQGKNLAKLFQNDCIMLDIVVQDTGIGIEEKRQKEIFSSFTQADISITRNYGGTGLGLAIVKQLTELMKGKVEVESKVGEGTKFTLKIPLKVIERITVFCQSAVFVQKDKDVTLQEQKATKKVLVAEDNLINMFVIEEILKKQNIKVIKAKNGKEALELFKKETFDLVMMDIHMPVMDGLTAIQEIRKEEKEKKTAKIPIVVLTADAFKEDLERAIGMGADYYLSKPFKQKDLLVILHELKIKQ